MSAAPLNAKLAHMGADALNHAELALAPWLTPLDCPRNEGALFPAGATKSGAAVRQAAVQASVIGRPGSMAELQLDRNAGRQC